MGLLLKLKNGGTDLKSLRYGNDRPGGGDSKQPFIKTPIPDDSKDPSSFDIDGIVRGGLLAPIEAATDVSRLTKYFFDTKNPSGLLFTTKQNLLSRIAPKTEATKGLAYGMGTVNDGIYTPLSTIAQAGVGFLGTHLNKQGLDPTGLIPFLNVNKYEDVVYENNQNSEEVFKKDKDGNIKVNRKGKPRVEKNINRLISLYNTTGLNPFFTTNYEFGKNTNIRSYDGGPDSILGVGRTNIKFATQNDGQTPLRTIHSKNDPVKKQLFYNPTQQIIDEKYSKSKRYERTKPNLLRNIGDAGTNSLRGKVINPINANPVLNQTQYDSEDFSVSALRRNNQLGDLIEFTIALAPGNDISNKQYLTFPAFLDGYSDSFSSRFNNINYMGRAETFYRYQGFNRSINLGFTVVAQSKREIGNMYSKLNFLASSIAASYTEAGYMTGNIVYLTVGNLINNQPGILESFTYDVPVESSWDIGSQLRYNPEELEKSRIDLAKRQDAQEQGYSDKQKSPNKDPFEEFVDLPNLEWEVDENGDVIQPGRLIDPNEKKEEEVTDIEEVGIKRKKRYFVNDGGVPMMIKVTGFKFTPLYDFIPEWGKGTWVGNSLVFNNNNNHSEEETPNDDVGLNTINPTQNNISNNIA